jgi:hypothetical protein
MAHKKQKFNNKAKNQKKSAEVDVDFDENELMNSDAEDDIKEF